MPRHNQKNPVDKRKLMHEETPVTAPPRMEGKVKNARLSPGKKRKGTKKLEKIRHKLHTKLKKSRKMMTELVDQIG